MFTDIYCDSFLDSFSATPKLHLHFEHKYAAQGGDTAFTGTSLIAILEEIGSKLAVQAALDSTWDLTWSGRQEQVQRGPLPFTALHI